jgi:hypothetical protein
MTMVPSIVLVLLLAAGIGVRLAFGATSGSPARYDDAYERAQRRPR